MKRVCAGLSFDPFVMYLFSAVLAQNLAPGIGQTRFLPIGQRRHDPAIDAANTLGQWWMRIKPVRPELVSHQQHVLHGGMQAGHGSAALGHRHFTQNATQTVLAACELDGARISKKFALP